MKNIRAQFGQATACAAFAAPQMVAAFTLFAHARWIDILRASLGLRLPGKQ
jgi:hypothetical protein